MSLLMDALSKAEKERHKVEKGADKPPEEEVLSEPEELFFANKYPVEEKPLEVKPLEEKPLDLSFLTLIDEDKKEEVEDENRGVKEKIELKNSIQDTQNEFSTELPDSIPLLDVIEQKSDLPAKPPAPKVESKPNYSTHVLGVAKKPSNQNPWFIGGGAVLLAALLMGYYYFKSMESDVNRSITGITNITLNHESPQGQKNYEVESEERALIEEKTVEILENPQAAVVAELKPVEQIVKKQKIAKQAAAVLPSGPKIKTEESPPDSIEPPQKEAAIHVQREAPKVDYLQQALEKAYQAYQTGYMIRAEQQYQIALQYEPDHLDALLGMAVISQSLNNEQQARAYYQKILTLNPKNSTAMSGLISMQQGSNQSASESRLKLLLSEEPDAAYLHAALGAQYVAGSRWPEAQQAFLKAYHYDSNNPDYTYNLAISLDHLGQTKTAIKYYKQALFLSKQFPAGFNQSVVESRLLSLSN